MSSPSTVDRLASERQESLRCQRVQHPIRRTQYRSHQKKSTATWAANTLHITRKHLECWALQLQDRCSQRLSPEASATCCWRWCASEETRTHDAETSRLRHGQCLPEHPRHTHADLAPTEGRGRGNLRNGRWQSNLLSVS